MQIPGGPGLDSPCPCGLPALARSGVFLSEHGAGHQKSWVSIPQAGPRRGLTQENTDMGQKGALPFSLLPTNGFIFFLLLLILRFLFQLEASKQLLRGCSHSIPVLLRHGKRKEPPERKLPGQRALRSLTEPRAFTELGSLRGNPRPVPRRASRQTDSWIFAPLRGFHHSVLD